MKALAFAIGLLLLPVLAAGHPLDPLTPDEIRLAAQVARMDPRFASARFASILLNEPPKADVIAWRAGQMLPRQARLVTMTATSVFEVVADLGARRMVSAVERKGVEPPVMLSEFETAKVVLTNPEFRAALAKRGVTDPEKVFCSPITAGYFAIPEHAGKRIIKVGCYDLRRTTTNMWGWPIERLYAVVDLHDRKVLSVADAGVVPIADLDLNFTEAAAGTLRAERKPTVMTQPGGPNFTVSGNEISWGNWRFHARVDGRVGTVISLARWQDGNALRSVLYQGYLSEMFVPYMDADYGWYSRTYFDTGEYGAGTLVTPLKPGVDCPASSAFLTATIGDDKGEPITTPNALCIFERDSGDPIWRHAEPLNQTYEGRPNVELVVRMAAAVGNYDYLFDWVFNDAAEIDARVGATGIDSVKGVATTRMTDATAAADTRYGTLVAPNLVAVNHDHYFNFRLDLDVDGTGNSFNQDTYRPVTLPAGSPRRSLYVVEPRIAATEKGAELSTGHEPAKFRVMNERRTNGVGNPVSYEVLFANHAKLLLDPSDWPAKRAGFLQHDLWVTPYAPAERYAGGEYMFQSTGSDGLPVWAARDRPIRNQDIVVWVNTGMHHLTRAEDLPVMPTIWHSFKLRPHNFFNRNPAIDLRKTEQERPRARVLVVNVPDVNHADSGNAGLAAIKELAALDRYDVDVCVDYGQFTDAYLAPYDAMVWVMAAPLTWTDASKAAFEKYVRSGKGFIGLHVAGLTGISRTPWPWFEEYLGGIAFKGHPARQTATVKVDPGAAAHPIMKGVSPSFSVFEEWYSWNKSPRGRPGVTVLAGLDETSYGVGNLAMGADHAFVWINEQYGRMMYAGFGHEPAIYADPNVRTLLRNAIRWAIRADVGAGLQSGARPRD